MTSNDKTGESQRKSISLTFDPQHSPEKVWRALTDPELLAEWLLRVIDLNLAEDALVAFASIRTARIVVESAPPRLFVDRHDDLG